MGLSKNWITENHIDFEYKKYILLAFLQKVGAQFERKKLYPPLSELISSYQQAIEIKENKEALFNSFPKAIKGFDLKNLKLKYQKIITDTQAMEEIENILNYSIPKFENYINKGKEIYDEIEEKIYIEPVGILPLNHEEGYILINNKEKKVIAYEFQITIFEQSNELYRGIHTNYIQSYNYSISNTMESIKSKLITQNKKMPNPATFAIESDVVLPLDETMLPIAKNCLMKYVSSLS